MAADFDPGDCRAEVFWDERLTMWAMRVRHVPTGTAITRYAGSDRPRDPFVQATWPSAVEDLRWLVAHRSVATVSPSTGIGVDGRP